MRPFLHRRLAQLVIAVLTFLAYSASITRKEKIRVHSQQITKPLILFSPTSGLGNSIFGLISVARLADILKADFGVVWTNSTTPALQIRYEDIFAGSIVYGTSEDAYKKMCGHTCSVKLTHRATLACEMAMTCPNATELLTRVAKCSCLHVHSNRYYPSLFQASDGTNSFMELTRKHLKPSVRLRQATTHTLNVWKKMNVSTIIGVHVRAAFISSEVKNGKFVPQKDIFARYFWSCVRESAQVQGIVGVFVAADTEQVRQEAHLLVQRHPNMRFLPSPLQIFPNDLDLGPQRDTTTSWGAAIEMQLLSRSSTLIVKGSESMIDSTFSSAAVAFANCVDSTLCKITDGVKCHNISDHAAVKRFKHGRVKSCEHLSIMHENLPIENQTCRIS